MASIISSANTAGADVFNAIGATARMAGKLASSASLAVDTLELKSQQLYDDTATSIAKDRPLNQQRAIVEAVDEHVAFLEQSFRRRRPNSDFPHDEVWNKTYAAVEASVQGKSDVPSLTLNDIFPSKDSLKSVA